MNENDISYKIIGAAVEMHKTLGPGLLESAYEAALAYDLRTLGLKAETQVPMPMVYKEVKMDVGYRLDLLVEDKVIGKQPSKYIFFQVICGHTLVGK